MKKIVGPNADAVNRVIVRVSKITAVEAEKLDAAWGDAQHPAGVDALNAAWNAAMGAAHGAARNSVRNDARRAAMGAAHGAALNIPAWLATRAAAMAAVVRDRISDEDYRALAGPWESVMGPIFKDE